MKRVGNRLTRDEWYAIPEGATHYYDITPEEGPSFFREGTLSGGTPYWFWWVYDLGDPDSGRWAEWGATKPERAGPLPVEDQTVGREQGHLVFTIRVPVPEGATHSAGSPGEVTFYKKDGDRWWFICPEEGDDEWTEWGPDAPHWIRELP